MNLLAVILGIAAAVGLAAAHLAFWTWYYRHRLLPDERHFFRTTDGWTLALARLRPGDGPGGGVPVLCCPGVACNGRVFDLDARHSLGRSLAARGFDVWMLDPRGTGESQRPTLRGPSWRYGFDEYVRQDAAAAVTHVLHATGAPRLLWVGHSLGGLVGLHLGARCPEGRAIGALLMLGSPLDLARHREHVGPLIHFLRAAPGWLPVVRLGRLCRFVAPLAGRLRFFVEPLFQNPRNVPGAVFRRFLCTVVEDVPRHLVAQFAGAVFRDLGFDGRPAAEERAALSTFDRPVISLAGDLDRIAPPVSCRADTRIAASLDCAAEVIDTGPDVPDIGHLDLLIGDAAPKLVYPRVAAWLLARASTRDSDAASAVPASRAAESSAGQPG